MLFEELNIIDAPSDASFWAGVGVGTVVVVGAAWVFCC